MRYKKQETGTNSKTTIYIDKLMEIVTEGSTVKRKVYVGSTAVVTDTEENGTTTRATHYLLKGRLGSTITVSNGNGDVVETNGFDPFGKPRTGLWRDKASNQLESQVTTRGYTGHEHLDESQLIHMNGRAYDYNLGRFLSVDPIIQSPTNSQSMNPYSYIMNNPLAGVDPTGYKAEIEQERFKVERVKVTGSNISRTKVTDTATGKSQLTSLSVSGAKSFLAQNGGNQSQGSSTMGGNVGGGDNSVSGIGSQNQQDESPSFLDRINPFSNHNLLKKREDLENRHGRSASCTGNDCITPEMADLFSQATPLLLAATPGRLSIGGNTGKAAKIKFRSPFSSSERAIIHEARGILNSEELLALKSAFEGGRPASIKINGRVIQVEPDLPFSAITSFEQNGFVMGKHAFSSNLELKKTLLHELHRLHNSATNATRGASGGQATIETQAAFEFAERAASSF